MIKEKAKHLLILYKRQHLKSSKKNNENLGNDETSKNENFNKLYPNFNITQSQNDFWDLLDDNTKDSSSIVEKLHRTIDYKNNYVLNENNGMKSFLNKFTNNSLNNSVYDRLYNRGFFSQNKIIIKRLKNIDNILKTSKTPKVSRSSLKYLSKTRKTNCSKNDENNKTFDNNEFTFKPKINSNLLKLMQNLPKKEEKIQSRNIYKI